MRKLVGGIAVTVIVGAALSGCVVFTGPVKVKQTGPREVTVTFTLCNSHEEKGSKCPDLGNSNEDGLTGIQSADEVVLLGLRVPNGTRTPNRILPVSQGVDGAFKRRDDYTQELNQKAPRANGFRWFGYSAPSGGTGDEGGADSARYDRARFRVTLRLRKGFDGRFKVRPVVGWADEPPGELDCGPDPFEYFADGGGENTICIDSPTRQKTSTSVSVKID